MHVCMYVCVTLRNAILLHIVHGAADPFVAISTCTGHGRCRESGYVRLDDGEMCGERARRLVTLVKRKQ